MTLESSLKPKLGYQISKKLVTNYNQVFEFQNWKSKSKPEFLRKCSENRLELKSKGQLEVNWKLIASFVQGYLELALILRIGD